MAINNYFDNADINIYFHMKNHYNKLRSARSTIDNSRPQGFAKALSTPPNSVRSLRRIKFDERDIKNDPHLPIYSGLVRKHSCITTASTSGTSNTSIHTINLDPKRKPSVTSFKAKCLPVRSHSTDSTKRKGTSTKLKRAKKKSTIVDEKYGTRSHKSESAMNQIENLIVDQQFTTGESDKSDSNRSRSSNDSVEKSNMQPRVEEHEYLQFLLRITEDIIINDLYTNEDIEKVFQMHIEANRNHLNVEKMEAQLARLCTELQIPYKNNEKKSGDLECYEHFFNAHPSHHNQSLEDCECTTKRILDVEIKDNKNYCEMELKEDNSEFYLKKICSILANKCSLDRVTECTEPSNSMDAIIVSMKQLSNTSIHDSERNILSINLDICNGNSTETVCDSNIDAEENILCHDDLTEKEKLGSKEEEILFEKINGNLINEIGDDNNQLENLNTESDISTNENSKLLESVDNVKHAIDQVKENPVTSLNILDNDVNKTVENLSITFPKNIKNCGHECLNSNTGENIEKNDIDLPLLQRFNENQLKCPTNDILLTTDNIQNNEAFKVINEFLISHYDTEQCNQASSSLPKCDGNQINSINNMLIMKEIIHNIKEITLNNNEPVTVAEDIPKITTNDQCTQMGVAHSDKECNTNIILDDYHKNDYVLLNGPVYVLKTILNSEDKLVVYDKDNIRETDKEIDQKLCDEKIEPTHYDTIPTLESQPKLDYIPPYMQNDFSKLLSSDYDLMPQRDSDTSNKYHHLLVDATTSISNVNLKQTLCNTFTNPNALLLSDKYELVGQFPKEESLIPETDNVKHSFQCGNRLCTNSQYELKSTLLKKVKDCLNISGSVNNKTETSPHKQIPDLDVPLTDTKESDVISKDLSESGEIFRANICTDEELSQISTFRSDNEISGNNLSPNRNILGKRKLKHPS